MRTAVILTPAREGGRFGPAVRGQDPEAPLAVAECHFWFDFETPIELERLAISNQRPLTQLSVSIFKNTMCLVNV